jgi:hypothetical protein
MRRFRPTLAAAALVCLLPAVTLAAAETETEKVHRVVPMGPNGALKLHNFSGTVTITGAEVQNVTIDAVRRATRERLDRIKLDIQSDGTTVVIEANKKDPGAEHLENNVVETDFEIQVPRDARLDVDVFSSEVTIGGVNGRLDVKSFSGGLHLNDVAAPSKAKTFSGAIDLQLAGHVSQPELDLETFSGGIELGMPGGAGAAVEMSTFSGEINSDVPLVVQSKSRRELKGDIGQPGSGRLKLKTFSGGVRIK